MAGTESAKAEQRPSPAAALMKQPHAKGVTQVHESAGPEKTTGSPGISTSSNANTSAVNEARGTKNKTSTAVVSKSKRQKKYHEKAELVRTLAKQYDRLSDEQDKIIEKLKLELDNIRDKQSEERFAAGDRLSDAICAQWDQGLADLQELITTLSKASSEIPSLGKEVTPDYEEFFDGFFERHVKYIKILFDIHVLAKDLRKLMDAWPGTLSSPQSGAELANLLDSNYLLGFKP